jgi:hypothetical protein
MERWMPRAWLPFAVFPFCAKIVLTVQKQSKVARATRKIGNTP